MKIAIILLTCGRVDYTRRTLDTLAAHNPQLCSQAMLLHGDDRSPLDQHQANCELARAAGFKTVLQPSLQYGVARMTELLVQEAAQHGADLVLNLQNDWESVRPLPLDDIAQLMQNAGVYTVRLYGRDKSPGRPAGIHHGGREPRRVVAWSPAAVAGWELGDIHWGHPPAVTRIERAIELTYMSRSESQSRWRSGKIHALTARPVESVMSHIGTERTVGFMA